MAAKFILSLDCEVKWGVADGLTAKSREMLADDRLEAAYNQIVRLLDEHELRRRSPLPACSRKALSNSRQFAPKWKQWPFALPAICSLRSTISTLTGRDGTDRTSWRS